MKRRSFLKGLTGAAMASQPSARLLASAASQTGTAKLQGFSYGAVRLLPGPLNDQFEHNHRLFLNLSEDSLLQPYRQKAGLPAPGEPMGGWYSFADYDPPKNNAGFVPGHSFGQYLSGLARAYAQTGDLATKAKVDRLVNGFAIAISPNFYKDYNLPAYTFEKAMCGLVDAHEFAGCRTALPALEKTLNAALPALPEKALSRKEMAQRGPHPNESFNWDESYTLPENFYLAYKRGAGAKYRALAQRFLQDDTYFNPLAADQNVLPGEHAYSHVNALSSAVQAYLTDGSEKHLRAAKNGFRYVQQQSFATGGWGPGETFQKPGSDGLAKSLEKNHSSFETPCGAYGHFKITRYLLAVTGDPAYGDSMERVLYNTILGARLLKPDGTSFYYADYSRDAVKVDYGLKWPCCSGTFPQLTADYGISSYLRDAAGVYVNLYVPSRLTWRQGSAKVEMEQQTQYPNDGEIALHMKLSTPQRFALSLRIPAWATGANRLLVNGRDAGVALQAGTWARVQREWRDKDRVELSFALPLALEPLPEHPSLIALRVGPRVLFAIQPGDAAITAENLLKATPQNAKSWKVATATGEVEMRPFDAITTERYRLYQQV
ncbi:glycoside hydrolase family 127 protein [Terriglobus tenax]|uniref:glycoside hydrolase family 127 protein n=1 Tax=Terriglobus tenax TaxID=1111115 RepID=UPI0021E03FD8|nr:glycoside hydrolase family 127 protein [Terriglobus tenax]